MWGKRPLGKRGFGIMKIQILSFPEQLSSEGTSFEVSHLLWGTKFAPPVTGRIGYVPGDGFYVEMTCFETDPLRRQTGFQVPVYLDSAMEAFFSLPVFRKAKPETLSVYQSGIQRKRRSPCPVRICPYRPYPVFGSRMPCAVTPCPSDAGLLETDLPSSAFPFGTDLRNHKIRSSRYLFLQLL